MTGPADLERRYAWTTAEQMRLHRAWLVKEVAGGAMSIDALFDEGAAGGRTGTVKVVVLAQSVPGVGKVRARRAMGELGISEEARWGEVDATMLRSLWAAMADAATRPI